MIPNSTENGCIIRDRSERIVLIVFEITTMIRPIKVVQINVGGS